MALKVFLGSSLITKYSWLENAEGNNILKSFNINDINKNILKASEGSVRKTLQFEEKAEIYDTINDILKNISNIDIIELINKAEIIYDSKNDIMEILNANRKSEIVNEIKAYYGRLLEHYLWY